jgi:phosphoribosyl 1,2-cyclic phosphodiesterase
MKKASLKIKRRPASRTQLTFWGVRGSIPTPGASTVYFGGNTSCVEVRVGKQIIIIDAGTGLRLLGQSLEREFGTKALDLTLLLTHTHWDHIQGLPFFPPLYRPKNHLRILGYEGARRGLLGVLSGQMESPFFPIGFDEVPGNVKVEELKDMQFQLGDVGVAAHFANHPGVCVGYRLNTPGVSLAFFPDNEPHVSEAGRARHRHNSVSSGSSESHTRHKQMIDFLGGLDVLVMDTQYTCKEYRAHSGWGHGCLDDVISLALEAGVKRLFLFHHDPDHDDAMVHRMAADAKKIVRKSGSKMLVEAARERASFRLV